MTEQIQPNFNPLSTEQLAALSETQREIFTRLHPSDREFFALNFSPAALGAALERKWEAMLSRQALDEHSRRLRERYAAIGAPQSVPEAGASGLSAGDMAVGAAGVAGLVGVGVVARKVAPQGKAFWRGVTPREMVEPLVKTFARQERTDIRFDTADAQGVLHAVVLLRTDDGLLPGLNISLAPLKDGLEVAVSKISQESLVQTFKEGGQSLVELLKDTLRSGWRSGGKPDLLDLAGAVMEHGSEIAKAVNDLDLEDKAWETIQRAAEPLQTIYDQRSAIEREQRLRLEMAWDDYNSCPRCRVEFSSEDRDCRVCGAARPPLPEQPDPRLPE